MAQKFSKKEVIRAGWNIMKKNFWFFAGILLFMFIVSYLPGLVFDAMDKKELPTIMTLFFFIAGIVFWIIQLIVSIGLVHIALKFVNGAKPAFGDLFAKSGKVAVYFASSLLYVIATVSGFIVLGALSFFNLISNAAAGIGFLFVLVLSIVFAIRFQFYQYYIVGKSKGPLEALSQSWRATKGSFWNLILLWLLMLVINLAGALALGIGLFLTIPTTMIAMAAVYKKLDTAKNA